MPLSVLVIDPVGGLTMSWKDVTFENGAVIVFKFTDLPRGNCEPFE